jgi:2-iminobutanoate/2-iminopropanoate deaminase
VFCSGQIPLDPDTQELVSDDVAEQTVRVLENLKGVLEAAGSSLGDVCKTTVFMTDLNDFAVMNSVYAKYFTDQPPARSTFEVSKLPGGAKVEIEAIALGE